jgi:hypothetical protein
VKWGAVAALVEGCCKVTKWVELTMSTTLLSGSGSSNGLAAGRKPASRLIQAAWRASTEWIAIAPANTLRDWISGADGEAGLLERDRGGDEFRGIAGRVSEMKLGTIGRARPQGIAEEPDVRLLVAADDLRELARLACQVSVAQGLGVERGLQSLDQQPKREDLLIVRRRSLRTRSSRELRGVDGASTNRPQHRERAPEQTRPRQAGD